MSHNFWRGSSVWSEREAHTFDVGGSIPPLATKIISKKSNSYEAKEMRNISFVKENQSIFKILFLPVAWTAFIAVSASSSWGSSEALFSNITIAEGVVEEVLQADRLLLADGQKIHLIGIDAPYFDLRAKQAADIAVDKPESINPETALEEQGYVFVQRLLEGKHVKIEYDTLKKDDEGDTLAYVFLPDGTFVNAEVLRRGFAQLKIRPPNLKYAERLREAYREARREMRGLQGE